MDRMLAAADEARRVMDDGSGGDLDLSGEEGVTRTQATGSEKMPMGARSAFSPDDHNQEDNDRQNGHRGYEPGRLEIDLICHLSEARPRGWLCPTAASRLRASRFGEARMLS